MKGAARIFAAVERLLVATRLLLRHEERPIGLALALGRIAAETHAPEEYDRLLDLARHSYQAARA